jgi:hypothetical protein
VRCAIHGLATGPAGRCALCLEGERRLARRRSDRRWRPVARFLVAVIAGACVFAWLLATFDTRPPAAPIDAGSDAG